MTVITRTIGRMIGGLMVIFGAYLLMQGERTPGGGFAGGIILASVYILIILVYGKERALKRLDRNSAIVLLSLGALTLLCTVFFSRSLFDVDTAILSDAGTGIIVMAAIFSVFIVIVGVKVKRKGS